MDQSERRSDHEAVLMVLSKPGTAVGLEEFHRWYDEEHVPLRMSTLPEFLTGARYESIDGQNDFAALYNISSLALFSQSKYTDLRRKRSTREAELFTRIGTIDRRTYRCLYDERNSPAGQYHPFLVTVELAQSSEDLQCGMKALAGWKRTQLCQLADCSIIGRDQPPSLDPGRISPILLIFEFDNQDFESCVQIQTLLKLRESGDPIVIRKWKLYRGWQNTSSKKTTSA